MTRPFLYSKQKFFNPKPVPENIAKPEINTTHHLKYLIYILFKYDNLLLVICLHSTDTLIGTQFCDFIENNLREKFQQEVEKLDEVEYVHIRPAKLLNSANCPDKVKEKHELKVNFKVLMIFEEIF